MEPEELRPIVDRAGGVKAFAEMTGASERAIYAWLDGTRKMGKPTAILIRRLTVAKATKGKGKAKPESFVRSAGNQ